MLGDAWSLLIVRDLMFKKKRRHDEFLNGGEGIATNILSDRLQRLERVGILTKRRDREDARRFVYRLTQKGLDLAPMLVELVLWSARHERTAAPAGELRLMRTQRARFLQRLRAEWQAEES